MNVCPEVRIHVQQTHVPEFSTCLQHSAWSQLAQSAPQAKGESRLSYLSLPPCPMIEVWRFSASSKTTHTQTRDICKGPKVGYIQSAQDCIHTRSTMSGIRLIKEAGLQQWGLLLAEHKDPPPLQSVRGDSVDVHGLPWPSRLARPSNCSRTTY